MFPPTSVRAHICETRRNGSPIAGGLDQISPVAVAVEGRAAQQGFKLTHDLAAVAASHRGHKLLEIFRPVSERGRDRGEALAFEARRLWHTGFEAIAGAERPGEVEARLGADPVAGDGG